MKLLATGLLVGAAMVFVVAKRFEDHAGWVDAIRAMSEAAMVGALADWFAVTALFRRPLGLPIPHTAIIPSNKDRIGRSLGGFVQEHFLDPELVDQRVAEAEVGRRMGAWLAEPVNASRVGATAASVLAAAGDLLDDEAAASAIEQAVVGRIRATPAAPLLASAIEIAVEEGHHVALVDTMLRSAATYLDDHREVFRARIRVESPWWVPEPIDDRVFEKVFDGAKRFLADLAADPGHELRRGVDRRLLLLVERLRTDPTAIAEVEARKERLLEHPSVRAWAGSIWGQAKAYVIDAGRDPTSELRRRLDASVAAMGQRLRDDPELQRTVDDWARRGAHGAVAQYGDGVSDFIASTVARWDAAETSAKLEAQVGSDLQFIRINGTIVGGLAGLAIYLIGQVL